MTAEQLAAIKARCAAATPGVWLPLVCDMIGANGAALSSHGVGPDGGSAQAHHDAHFIAHARADVPALVAEVERLRALLAEGMFG